MSITHTTGRLYTAAAPTQARDTSDTSDAALIRSIAVGNKDAMRILFTRHRVRIYRFLLRFVADGSTAEDLVSEVFLDVWRQAPEFQGRSQVGTTTRNQSMRPLKSSGCRRIPQKTRMFYARKQIADLMAAQGGNRMRVQLIFARFPQMPNLCSTSGAAVWNISRRWRNTRNAPQ